MTKITCQRCSRVFIIKKRHKWNPNKYCSTQCRLRALSAGNKGKPKSSSTRNKISNKQKLLYKNKKRPKMRYWKGSKFSEEYKNKLSSAHKGKSAFWNIGKKNGQWKGGVTPINLRIRGSLKYKLWRESIFKRDNWTCVVCNVRGGILNADHIKPFSLYPDLRFCIDNGRTLCLSCHRTTPTYGKNLRIRGGYSNQITL